MIDDGLWPLILKASLMHYFLKIMNHCLLKKNLIMLASGTSQWPQFSVAECPWRRWEDCWTILMATSNEHGFDVFIMTSWTKSLCEVYEVENNIENVCFGQQLTRFLKDPRIELDFWWVSPHRVDQHHMTRPFKDEDVKLGMTFNFRFLMFLFSTGWPADARHANKELCLLRWVDS